MVVKFQGRPSMPPTSYLFIDAASLHSMLTKLSVDYGGLPEPVINWRNVASSHRKIFYYDALPSRRTNQTLEEYQAEERLKKGRLAEIEKQNRFHVRSGVTRHRKGRGNEQKMVDILLAVDALTMGHRGLFDSATIVTSDLDFEPLIKELVNIGIEVNLIHSAHNVNEDLIVSADIATPMTIDFVHGQSWLDFAGSRLSLPQIRYKDDSSAWEGAVTIEELELDRFGTVRVSRSGEDYMAECRRVSDGPPNKRALISAKSQIALKSYAKHKFGLEILKN